MFKFRITLAQFVLMLVFQSTEIVKLSCYLLLNKQIAYIINAK